MIKDILILSLIVISVGLFICNKILIKENINLKKDCMELGMDIDNMNRKLKMSTVSSYGNKQEDDNVKR